jgi:O-antigen ligase
MNSWLLSVANSKTPTVALIVGILIMLFAGLSWVSRRFIGGYLFAAGVLLVVSEWMFGIYKSFLELLGRDATLTDRTLLWEDLLKVDINPWLGAGFEGFWLGDRLRKLWAIWAFRPNQAHNGYLETYLNLGFIGLFLVLAVLVSNYWKACREILVNLDWGRYRLGFLVALIIYNWTEAAFKATHPLFFMLYLIALDLPGRGKEDEDEEEEFLPDELGQEIDPMESDGSRLRWTGASHKSASFP